MREEGIPASNANMPFVFIYERVDLSTTLYGLQVYPETIKEVLLNDVFSPFVTGRISLATKFNDAHDQYLEINTEMKHAKEPTVALTTQLQAEIVKNLMAKNSEFRELAHFLGPRAEPRIVFWPHEDPTYFRRDIKQRWVIKT